MKTTTPLTAQERVILFCTATGVSHAAVGITAHAMQSMAIKGFIVHDRESGAYALTDSGRAALLAILGDAGLTQTGPRGGSADARGRDEGPLLSPGGAACVRFAPESGRIADIGRCLKMTESGAQAVIPKHSIELRIGPRFWLSRA